MKRVLVAVLTMALAIIARETKRARLLSLGTPIANRPDPVRVATEAAVWGSVQSHQFLCDAVVLSDDGLPPCAIGSIAFSCAAPVSRCWTVCSSGCMPTRPSC